MNIRYILLAAILSATIGATAQTVQPVLDSAAVAKAIAIDNGTYVEPKTVITDSIPSATEQWRNSVKTKIDDIMADGYFNTVQGGVMVWDLTDDAMLYQHNSHQTMRPASTMKLVTAITALDKLGADYRLTTRVLYSGSIDDSTHTLRGNIYCVAGMDPMLRQSDINAIADSIKGLGVRTITGSLIADKSFRDNDKMGEGWCWDDDDTNPSLEPLLIDGRNTFLAALRRRLSALGVTVNDGYGERRVPTSAKPICERSHAMTSVMRDMMKQSKNLNAESVFYQIAHAEGGRGASARYATRVEKRLIKKIGLDADDYNFADGSGLSLYNYVSPEMLAQLLRYAWQHKDIYEALLPTMPVAGIDGTLQSRMRGTAAQGNVRAKTGTVKAISTLAGFCKAANGHQLAFAIMMQGCLRNNPARARQDRICRVLCEVK